MRSENRAGERHGGAGKYGGLSGHEGVPVDVQVMVAPGKIGMQIVGLPDKAVAESRERVQAALHASGLALPPKRVTIISAPARPAEGRLAFRSCHRPWPDGRAGGDPADALSGYLVIGEINLDGTIAAVAGRLARRHGRQCSR